MPSAACVALGSAWCDRFHRRRISRIQRECAFLAELPPVLQVAVNVADCPAAGSLRSGANCLVYTQNPSPNAREPTLGQPGYS